MQQWMLGEQEICIFPEMAFLFNHHVYTNCLPYFKDHHYLWLY